MKDWKTYAKALVGAVVAGLSALVPVVGDGLTPAELATVAIAFLLGLGVVYAVPNKPAPTPVP